MDDPDGLTLVLLTLPPMPIKMESRTALVLRTATPAAHLPAVLEQVVRDHSLQSSWLLLLDLSPAQDANTALKDRFLRVCILDDRSLTRVTLSPDPCAALARLVAGNAKLGEISPYQTGGGVENPLLFFGRDSELALLGGREARNHLLIGARQMGKSSLLKELRRRSPERTWLLTLTGGDLDADLRRASLPTLADLEARGPAEVPPVLLVDEADLLVQSDRDAGYPLLRRLRALSETGRCRFVLAGYWQLHHAAYLEHQAPIRNFGEPVPLDPLDPASARLLATRPLEPLGVRWADDTVLDELLRRTGCRPNLVAIACNAAVKSLPPLSDRVLTRETLEAVLDVGSRTGREIHDALKDRGALTTDPRASAIDLLCQYAMVDDDAFTRTDLRRRLEAAGVRVPEPDLEESLERLVLSYTLVLEDNAYHWPVPLVRDVIRRACDGDPAAMLARLAMGWERT